MTVIETCHTTLVIIQLLKNVKEWQEKKDTHISQCNLFNTALPHITHQDTLINQIQNVITYVLVLAILAEDVEQVGEIVFGKLILINNLTKKWNMKDVMKMTAIEISMIGWTINNPQLFKIARKWQLKKAINISQCRLEINVLVQEIHQHTPKKMILNAAICAMVTKVQNAVEAGETVFGLL